MTAKDAGKVEREVKLGAWAGLQMPDLDDVVADARVELLPPLRLAATYFDTADLRLARWGVTVRHRTSVPATSEQPWTVKLPAGPGGEGRSRGASSSSRVPRAGSPRRWPASCAAWPAPHRWCRSPACAPTAVGGAA